ncbi:hypothetical protein [Microbacterium sp. LWH12-1.2]|uniref:hypothetical protein n=1 Tax=Microbacterium sp. LWH12-1.2 TaxID=3135259 RepID=UPI0034445166
MFDSALMACRFSGLLATPRPLAKLTSYAKAAHDAVVEADHSSAPPFDCCVAAEARDGTAPLHEV